MITGRAHDVPVDDGDGVLLGLRPLQEWDRGTGRSEAEQQGDDVECPKKRRDPTIAMPWGGRYRA